MLEKMMQDMFNDEELNKKVKQAIRAQRDALRRSAEQDHREKVMQRMQQKAEEMLNVEIANQMALTLQQEAGLDFRQLKEKCAAVRNLSDELLEKHIQWAIDKGYMGAVRSDGTILYVSLRKAADK